MLEKRHSLAHVSKFQSSNTTVAPLRLAAFNYVPIPTLTTQLHSQPPPPQGEAFVFTFPNHRAQFPIYRTIPTAAK